MSKLEDLRPNASVRGILPNCLVTVVSAQWFGSEALELTYKDPAGKLANELLYRHDETRLEIAAEGRPWSFDGDGHQVRSSRRRTASDWHACSIRCWPRTPRSSSRCPHQITGAYESMLPRQPLRFLLADDPGAGKTIMASAAGRVRVFRL